MATERLHSTAVSKGQGPISKILVTVVLLLASLVAYASDDSPYKPFPEAQITQAPWDCYRSKIFDSYGSSLRQVPAESLEVLHSPDEVMHFAFTRRVIPHIPLGSPALRKMAQSTRSDILRTLESILDEPVQP